MIDFASYTRLTEGRLVCGKKQPPLTYWVASIRSKEPISLVSPSGSMKKETEGMES